MEPELAVPALSLPRPAGATQSWVMGHGSWLLLVADLNVSVPVFRTPCRRSGRSPLTTHGGAVRLADGRGLEERLSVRSAGAAGRLSNK